MNRDAERRLRVVYLGGTVFFTALAWLFRINLVLGLAAMPAVVHLIWAERARRAGKAVRHTPLGKLHRLVIWRELAAAALFVTGAGYVAVRMAGSPRLAWLELVIGALLVTYVMLVRAATVQARATIPPEGGPPGGGEGGRPPGEQE